MTCALVTGMVFFFLASGVNSFLFNLLHPGRYSLKKGVMLHMFEWKYEDIARECENFLQHRGFAAVVISPPSENIVKPNRPWWERYQPVSYNLITRSGDEDQLKDMLSRCNKVGVRVIADVVLNHMAKDLPEGEMCLGTAGSGCDPNNFLYPAVPFSYNDFHHTRTIIDDDYKDAYMVRYGELEGLHDLDQKRKNVQETQVRFLNYLISLGIAGFRIEAAKHMEPGDLKVILNQLENINTDHGLPWRVKPLIYLDVIDKDEGQAVTYKDYEHIGMMMDVRYGKQLGLHFNQNEQNPRRLKDLKGFGDPTKWNLLPKDSAVVFIESHDTQHGTIFPDHIDFRNSQLYKMAVAFMLAWDWGTPVLTSSYYFDNKDNGPPADESGNIRSPIIEDDVCDKGMKNGWACEHRWRQIYNMVEFHNVVKGTEVKEWWDNGQNQIAFCRGDKGFIAFNLEFYELKQEMQTCLPSGIYCDVITGELKDNKCTGGQVTVDENGMADITVNKKTSDVDGMLALHVQDCIGCEKKKRKKDRLVPRFVTVTSYLLIVVGSFLIIKHFIDQLP